MVEVPLNNYEKYYMQYSGILYTTYGTLPHCCGTQCNEAY